MEQMSVESVQTAGGVLIHREDPHIKSYVLFPGDYAN
jgi:hypothetical protein